jgi:hypothetical protein
MVSEVSSKRLTRDEELPRMSAADQERRDIATGDHAPDAARCPPQERRDFRRRQGRAVER